MKTQKIVILTAILTIIFSSFLYAQKLPKPVGYVNDFAGVIDPASKQKMESIIRELKQKTGAEIAVVTVDSIEPYGSIEEYSIDLATKWGVGKKGEDTGILIVLAMKERKIRIEVGYGLEGIIPDGLAGEIIDRSILPSLKSGLYGTGLLKGVEAVSGIIAKEYNVKITGYDLSESAKYTRSGAPGIGLISLIILLFLFGGRFFLPLIFLGGFGRGFFGGGFGSGGSGFGGGFSGFGGGGFGGGGASRGF